MFSVSEAASPTGNACYYEVHLYLPVPVRQSAVKQQQHHLLRYYVRKSNRYSFLKAPFPHPV